MKTQSFLKSLLAVSLLLSTMAAVGGPEAEAPSLAVVPENPAVGRSVLFREASRASAEAVSWHWDFGDGETSDLPAPLHVYRFPGVYTVTLTVLTGSGSQVQRHSVEVSADNTLRLLGGRFEVTLSARDQRTGRTGQGMAIPQGDLFGFFSIPEITSNPDNPEMFVKMLDARVVNGEFWFFYNGLTDLDVTLTVREVPTGVVKTYRKEPGSACGGFDTSGFSSSAPTPTPTSPAPTPSPTPTPGSGTTIPVTVSQWRYTPGTSPPIDVTAGVPTTLIFSSADVRHGFTGIAALGISGSDNISPGASGEYGAPGEQPANYVVTFTAPVAMRGRTFAFSCTVPSCGIGHSTMTGSLRVN